MNLYCTINKTKDMYPDTSKIKTKQWPHLYTKFCNKLMEASMQGSLETKISNLLFLSLFKLVYKYSLAILHH